MIILCRVAGPRNSRSPHKQERFVTIWWDDSDNRIQPGLNQVIKTSQNVKKEEKRKKEMGTQKNNPVAVSDKWKTLPFLLQDGNCQYDYVPQHSGPSGKVWCKLTLLLGVEKKKRSFLRTRLPLTIDLADWHEVPGLPWPRCRSLAAHRRGSGAQALSGPLLPQTAGQAQAT